MKHHSCCPPPSRLPCISPNRSIVSSTVLPHPREALPRPIGPPSEPKRAVPGFRCPGLLGTLFILPRFPPSPTVGFSQPAAINASLKELDDGGRAYLICCPGISMEYMLVVQHFVSWRGKPGTQRTFHRSLIQYNIIFYTILYPLAF